MIKYNYTIKRLKEDRMFKPVEQYLDLDNYSVIRGRNAIGKSTLLHLLAYSFFGYDQRSYESRYHQINKILSEKIKQFNDDDEQILYSNFEITTEGSDIRLCSEKNENEDFPKVYELDREKKKSYLSYEKFAQKYCLIYDIPDKPTDRISNLVEDVKILNQRLIAKVDKFSDHLEKVNNDILASKDPKNIVSLQNKVDRLEATLDPLCEKLNELNGERDLIELLIASDKYVDLTKNINDKEKKIEELKQKKTSDSKENKKRERIIKQIRESYSNLYGNYLLAVQKSAQITPINDTDQFKRLKEKTTFIRLTVWDWCNDVRNTLCDYADFLNNIYDKYKSDHKVADIYEKLLNLLNELDRNGEKLPKFKLPDLIQGVSEMVVQHTQNKQIAEGIKEVSEIIEMADNNLGEFITSTEDFGEGCRFLNVNDDSESMHNYAPKIDELKNVINKLEMDKRIYVKKLSQLGVDIADDNNIIEQIRRIYPSLFKKYCAMDIRMLENSLNNANRSASELEKRIKEYEIEKHLAMKLLEDTEKMEIHPLYSKRDVIHDLYNKMLNIKSDVSQYNNYFAILSNNSKMGGSDNKITFYNSMISKYLAKKLGKIPYIDAHVEVLEVDYLNRRFILAGSNTVVKFDYFSTGQAQCIYLKSLLNQNMDRKVILLLDEISSMDEDTLKIIHNEIREKRTNGQLLVALLAEKSNSAPYVEVL